jgi:hypothetical protein
MEDNFRVLILKLTDKTEQGRISWRMSNNIDEYIAHSLSSTFVVGKTGDFDIYFYVTNNFDTEISRTQSYQEDVDHSIMERLYMLAMESCLKVDDSFINIIKEVDGL